MSDDTKNLDPVLREQVALQCDVVAHSASALANVHSDYAKLLRKGIVPGSLDMVGDRSAAFMEILGDALNAMDAIDPDADAWTYPVYSEAQRLFPQQQPETVNLTLLLTMSRIAGLTKHTPNTELVREVHAIAAAALTKEVGEADAALIAAAPVLLQACERALDWIEADEESHGRTFGVGNELRAAISRAEGNTP